jgi:hypothetical protein
MTQVKEFHLPDDLYYDRKEHIWARLEGEGVRAGLDAFGVCAAIAGRVAPGPGRGRAHAARRLLTIARSACAPSRECYYDG